MKLKLKKFLFDMVMHKERPCFFCSHNIPVDYKEVPTLRQFLSPYAKILPRKRTKLCALHQRKAARAIKQARIMALLPFVQR